MGSRSRNLKDAFRGLPPTNIQSEPLGLIFQSPSTSLSPIAVLSLQKTIGNRKVQRLLAQRRPIVQRWADEAAAQQVLRAIETASAQDLRTLLHSFDQNVGDQQAGVTLPGPVSAAIAVADAAQLRQQVQFKLAERLMEDLCTTRTPVLAQMNAATTDIDRRTAMVRLRTLDQPLLDEIRTLTTGRRNRWEHPTATVQDAVLAALQLESIFHAEGHLANPDPAHESIARAVGMATSFDWCGFFAAESYMSSNLDRDLRAGYFHVNNVEDYFTYTYGSGADARIKRWIYADDTWSELRTYHASRNSERHWINAETLYDGSALDIRPGDILMIDHSGSPRPDHIVMVQSWNPTTRTVFTIGGNDGGYEVDNRPVPQPPRRESEANRERRERLEAATGQHLRPGGAGGHVGIGMQSLAAPSGSGRRPRVRVFGIGRPSIVDFEDHFYDNTSSRRPPAGPPRRR